MFQSTKISGNLKSAIKNQHLKIKFKNHSSIFSKFSVRDIVPHNRYRRAIWAILSVTRWGHSPYEMGAFPLQDEEHFPLRGEQTSISSADRNEKLARASAYPLGWASGQVLLSSGVGYLQIT